MKTLFTLAVLLLPLRAWAACTVATNGFLLGKPAIGDAGNIWAPCIQTGLQTLNGSTVSFNGVMAVGTNTAPTSGLLLVSTSSTAAYPVLDVRNKNNTGLLRVQQDGKVGIGTTNPSFLLHGVNDADAETAFMMSNSNAGTSVETDLYVSNGNTSATSLFLQSLGTGFTTTGGFVQDGGNIGTGTGLSGGLSIMTRANAPIRFYTNGHTNERVRITESGNVGIGTTAPHASYMLTLRDASNAFILVSSGAAASQDIGSISWGLDTANDFAVYSAAGRNLLLGANAAASGTRVIIPSAGIVAGSALCINASRLLAVCTSAVGAGGGCTCP